MEEFPQRHNSSEENVKVVDGVKYKKVNTGYSLREYYSLTAPDPTNPDDMRPGPGWDSRWRVLEEYGVDDPSELPNDPHTIWERVEEEK